MRNASAGNNSTNCAVMGYSMRVNAYRYTEWVAFDYTTTSPVWAYVYGVELYDHSAAPVPTSWDMETVNVAGWPEHEALVQELHRQLVACGPRPDACYA